MPAIRSARNLDGSITSHCTGFMSKEAFDKIFIYGDFNCDPNKSRLYNGFGRNIASLSFIFVMLCAYCLSSLHMKWNEKAYREKS